MAGLSFDLKHAIRSLARSPGLFASAALLLALGIGATTSIYSVVSRVLLDPLPYQEPDRLVMIWGDLAARDVMHFPESPTNLHDYQEQSHLFEAIGGVTTVTQPFVPESGEARQLTTGVISWNFLSILGVEPILGRGLTAEDGAFNASEVPPGTESPGNALLPPRTALISHHLWRQEFDGDPTAVGEIVDLGAGPVQIVGVLPRDFRLHMPAPAGIASEIDIWTPVRVDYGAWPRNNAFLQMIGRLKQDVSLEQAQAEIAAISERINELAPTLRIAKSRKWVRPFESELTADVDVTLWALTGAALFVLLIACANVANLLLVRAAGRARELSVRSALGAGRGRLVRQMLLESAVLAFTGAAGGSLLALTGLEIILRSAPENIPRLEIVGIDSGVLLFVIVMAGVTTLLSGIVPAIQGSRLRLADELKERSGTMSSRSGNRLKAGLVAGEIALSFVLLVGMGLMIRSFIELQGTDTGFEAEGLLTFEVALPFTRYAEADSRNRFYDEFQERLANLPGVTSVSGVTPLPLAGEPYSGRYSADAVVDDTSSFSQAQYRIVLPGYFETMQLELLAGRLLNRDDDENARPYVVVDKTLAQKAWPGTNPIGRQIWVRVTQEEMTRFEIVGVVQHEVQKRLQEIPRETIYFPNGSLGAFGGINDWVLRTSVDPLSIVPQVKTALASMDPRVPLAKVHPMTDHVADAMARTNFALQLISAFGVAALTIAAIGLYAVIHHAVRQRRGEIGVRMSFGAVERDVVMLFLRYGLVTVATGLSIGVVAALGLSRGINGFLVGVAATDPATYAGAMLLFVLIALTASLVPAWRASRVEPMCVLREE